MSTKKIIETLVVSIFLIVQLDFVYCQENDNKWLVEAKLWNSKGDTICGLIDFINPYNLQFSIVLLDSAGSTIKYFTPRDIEGFYYSFGKEKIIFHSVDNPFNIGKVFLQLIHEGVYSVYLYLEVDQRSSILAFIPHYYLRKEDWLEPDITLQFEKEALLKHFSNCPELEYKIKTGEYTLKSISTIIEEYEKCVLTDDYEYFYE